MTTHTLLPLTHWIPSLRRSLVIGVLATLAAAQTSTVNARENLNSIKNLERERAVLIDHMRSTKLTPQQRHKAIQQSRRRLVDMERMVIRDDRLQGSASPLVSRTFSNYELSFLVHASTESQRQITDHWLAEVGLTSETLLSSRKGRR